MRKHFPHIILCSALFISIVAEYFSIFGISKLFSGSHIEVIVLAIALGLAKLVAVSSVQQFWDRLGKSKYGKILRIYLSIATLVLMIVTTIGVYGFLASAYQNTANEDRLVQTKIDLMKVKKDRFKDQLTQISGESKSLAVSLETLRKSLGTDNQYQSIDRKTGQVITQIQTTSKKGVQDQIDKTSTKKDDIDLKIDRLNDSINQYDYRILETESNSKTSSELGPLKYLSGLTGYSMDRIVNWLMLLLVVVIDPLAIALMLTAQFAFRNDRWIRGVETRKKNAKSKNAAKSSTNDDLDPDVQIPTQVPDRSIQGKSRRNKGIVGDVPKPKRKYTKRQPKIEHFNVDIDPIADPDGTMRTVVDTQLSPDAKERLEQKKS